MRQQKSYADQSKYGQYVTSIVLERAFVDTDENKPFIKRTVSFRKEPRGSPTALVNEGTYAS